MQQTRWRRWRCIHSHLGKLQAGIGFATKEGIFSKFRVGLVLEFSPSIVLHMHLKMVRLRMGHARKGSHAKLDCLNVGLLWIGDEQVDVALHNHLPME